MFFLSRVPVHSVIIDVPRRWQAPAITPRRRRPSLRTSSSGWAMLKVPETAATVMLSLAAASSPDPPGPGLSRLAWMVALPPTC